MPELPEVETISRGLARYVQGKRVSQVEVWHSRSVRRHPGGATDFVATLSGQELRVLRRRGKFMWFELPDNLALVMHLGMSGQLHVFPAGEANARRPHEHVRMLMADGTVVSFVDQRTFGHQQVVPLVVDPAGAAYGVPQSLLHIAPDPLEECFDAQRVVQAWRRSSAPIKAGLLNQSVVSGIGNIYADEALYRSGVHGARRGHSLRLWEGYSLLENAAAVMRLAISQGGTSFDALYVDVEGQPGYFRNSLSAYGRAGLPCQRCSEVLQSVTVAGRSHVFCPHCQPRSHPRARKCSAEERLPRQR